ncbi:hypothetical protein SAMN05443999_1045 [Roseovarius azorensis]|uniref:Phytanoyl-CoA dioxygenase (PhyH) n=1 Tax=Roseovarius azorensis TaxID=1287727 RepID=A0A1H7N0N5_9RHOB|nr:hypothetical protein SAMN05443999_1045 [Roseovarius azorensis]
MVTGLTDAGWALFAPEKAVSDWAGAARAAALERVRDPEEQARSLTCEGTWFVGVDCLPNDARGAVGQSGPLCGAALTAAQRIYGQIPLHRAQVSVIYPGYPRPRDGEDDAAFRYRLSRDAAHVDGLLPVGAGRRRMLRERHAYILGLPLTGASPDASPLVVWQGSHHVMRRAFAGALGGIDPRDWGDVDLTGIYQAARREVFETCPRIPLAAEPGAAYLIHRMALHGVAPWGEAAEAPPEGRMVAYFRPELQDIAGDEWLRLP